MKTNRVTEEGRLLRLFPAFVESARITRFQGIVNGILEALKAGRGDAQVLKETRRIIEELPEEVVNKFIKLYQDRDPSDKRVKSKYYNLPVHIAHAVWQAKQLGLYHSKPGLRIVDLGTGFGYFPLVCDSIGHTATGLDWDRWKVYEGISHDIRIDRLEWVVTPDQPMPVFGAPVDVVTAFRPVFYYEFEDDSLWNEEKWSRFFTMIGRQLAANGLVYIGENRLSEGQRPHYEAMVECFKRKGAEPLMHGWLFHASAVFDWAMGGNKGLLKLISFRD